MEEKDFILESARNLKRWEEIPRRVADDYADMDRDELVKLVIFLQERLEEADLARRKEREESSDRISGLTAQVSALTDKISELTEQLRKNNGAMSAMAVQMAEQSRLINEKDRKISELQSTVKVGRKHLFGKKSQKGTKSRGDDNRTTPHTDVEEDFDGTPESLPDNLDVDVETGTAGIGSHPSTPQKECRIYRLGKTYRTMDADNRVFHKSDLGKLPEGAVVIRTYPRYTYDQKTVITEHAHEIVVYRDKDGNVMCGYFPMDSEKDEPVIESVPGTHAAPDMMAYLVFNRFFLDTPVYRETARLLQERMRVSRQTVTNWLEKGSQFFRGVIEYLKDQCLEKDSVEFKYAAEIEHDVNARRFLEYIGRLYALEKKYEEENLSAEQVRRLRNSAETTEIIIGMRSLLDLMKSENAPRHGSLMKKAVSYLDHFWKQVFLYRKDGNYTINNSLAERCIRSLANERKNSLFFGSDKMARVSAAYHSIVSTCKLQGYSILEYLKKFFAEITAGNRDYGKLMPSTIGISANKL